MDNLPEDIQTTIYKYKHQLEFCVVVEELNHGVLYYCGWCGKCHRLCRQCQCEGGTFCDDGSSDSDIDSDDFWMYRL